MNVAVSPVGTSPAAGPAVSSVYYNSLASGTGGMVSYSNYDGPTYSAVNHCLYLPPNCYSDLSLFSRRH